MSNAKRKLLLLTGLVMLLTLGWAGCRGFFVKPTLTSITVTPDKPNLTVGATQQMTATGKFDDGSTSNLTGSSTWTSSDATHVSVNSTGLITAVANTTTAVTITATNGTVSGTTTVTVGATQTLTITSVPASPISLSGLGGSTGIVFSASLNGTDVTAQTAFTSDNTAVISLSPAPNTNQGTVVGTGTANITGTDGSVTGSAAIVVNP